MQETKKTKNFIFMYNITPKSFDVGKDSLESTYN